MPETCPWQYVSTQDAHIVATSALEVPFHSSPVSVGCCQHNGMNLEQQVSLKFFAEDLDLELSARSAQQKV